MNLYFTSGLKNKKDDDSVEVRWSGTQADAGKDRKAMKAEGLHGVDTQDVEVPTHKAGLLEFLNKHKVDIGAE